MIVPVRMARHARAPQRHRSPAQIGILNLMDDVRGQGPRSLIDGSVLAEYLITAIIVVAAAAVLADCVALMTTLGCCCALVLGNQLGQLLNLEQQGRCGGVVVSVLALYLLRAISQGAVNGIVAHADAKENVTDESDLLVISCSASEQ